MTKISNKDLSKIKERYSSRFEEHGLDIQKTLKPGSIEHYKRQHEIHLSGADLEDKAILDVGCGLATYKDFLDKKNIKYKSYTGIDIVSDFIKTNKKQHPNSNFFCGTLDEYIEMSRNSYDVITFCQVFNNNFEETDNMELVQSQLSSAFMLSNEMVSCDFIGNYVNYNDDFLYYYSPESIFAFCKSLTPYVLINSSYSPYHYTVFLYKSITK